MSRPGFWPHLNRSASARCSYLSVHTSRKSVSPVPANAISGSYGWDFEATLGLTSGGDGQGAADLTHLGGADSADVAAQPREFDRLHVIQVGCRGVLEPFLRSQEYFARSPANGRGDGSDHHRGDQADNLLSGQYQNWPGLVWR